MSPSSKESRATGRAAPAGKSRVTKTGMPRRAPRRRPQHPMPAFVRTALTRARLMDAYRERPPFQRNDYIGWIQQAKREQTRQRRLQQMLDELRGGTLYMKMRWSPRVGG